MSITKRNLRKMIEKEAEHFFEWPDASNKTSVTYTSCLLFAEFIARIIENRDKVIADRKEDLILELMEASKPYLSRKKMTPRNQCERLNEAWNKCNNATIKIGK